MRFAFLVMTVILTLGVGSSAAQSAEESAVNPAALNANGQPARLLSAFFGLNNGLGIGANRICPGASGQDGIPVVLSHTVDPDTLQPEDFRVFTRSGAERTPFCLTLGPGEVRLIDYYENSGEGLSHYVGVLNEKRASRGFVYGHHWAPHDIRVKELGTGKSRFETAAGLGITFDVVRKLPVDDGINAARLLLPRCWFDEERCRVGIEALTFYRKDYNERMQQYSDTPVHDWASHGADAFRGLAVRHKTPTKKRQRLHQRPRPRMRDRKLAWMG